MSHVQRKRDLLTLVWSQDIPRHYGQPDSRPTLRNIPPAPCLSPIARTIRDAFNDGFENGNRHFFVYGRGGGTLNDVTFQCAPRDAVGFNKTFSDENPGHVLLIALDISGSFDGQFSDFREIESFECFYLVPLICIDEMKSNKVASLSFQP